MRVLICGSREWTDVSPIYDIINNLSWGDTVIAGGAHGADEIAEEIAIQMEGINLETFPARWDLHGKSAGPKRNIEMLEQKPDIVYAFPDKNSRGTWHTIKEAEKRGINTIVYGDWVSIYE